MPPLHPSHKDQGPFIGPVPRANQLYGRIMIGAGIITAALTLVGLVWAFALNEHGHILPYAYPALLLFVAASFLPKRWEKVIVILHTSASIVMIGILLYVISIYPSAGIIVFTTGFTTMVLYAAAYKRMSALTRRALARFGYDVQPLS